MTMLNKTTWCWDCGPGELTRQSLDYDESFFVDICSHCGAKKYTNKRTGNVYYIGGVNPDIVVHAPK